MVASPFWDSTTVTNVGAVTFGDGTNGTVGTVTAANSLTGSSTSDLIGDGGVTALANGNYVVSSLEWRNGSELRAGPATFGNGTTGIIGELSVGYSLVGSTANDRVGDSGIFELSTGNYVVLSPN